MRTLHRLWLASALMTAVLATGEQAAAQIDIEPPRPNVLLLVDTSGSMEYMPDGSLPATCTPTATSDLNRWATLVTVLTGTVQARGCFRQDRKSVEFVNEFKLAGLDPYDRDYKLPHHRIVSNGCVAGPGNLPSSVFDWPTGAIAYHQYTSVVQPCNNGIGPDFVQDEDGLMDAFRDRVRFALMTFDPHSNPGTGYAGAAMNAATGMAGMWSYFPDWASGAGTPAQGNPDECALSPFEVGARNPAAPPWEGRLISGGAPSAPLLPTAGQVSIREINGHIQEALLALRPYGATPLAGMMEDAYTFYRLDDWVDPVTGQPFAPAADPYYSGGCRGSYIIVLSDGEPNLDLKPACEAGTGHCPYREPYEVARELATNGPAGQLVRTFAVGFGLSSTASMDCDDLVMPNDYEGTGPCVGATGSLKACCTLARIAYEGQTTKAYFADDTATLKSALSNVFAQIASGSTSRTVPAFSGGSAVGDGDPDTPDPKAYEFVSSFDPITGDHIWQGNLERKRWVCENTAEGYKAVLKSIDQSIGDDFAWNINQGESLRARQFMTVVGQSVSNNIYSRRSIRPHLTGADDGIGTYSGVTYQGGETDIASVMQGHPKAMELDPIVPTCSAAVLQASSPGDCAYKVMNWQLGGSNGTSFPSRDGHEFGAIYHSSPFVIGTPDDYLRDESYAVFAVASAERPLMLYTATTDGQLHAFKVATNKQNDADGLGYSQKNNELWSFLPPHVLPGIMSQYPTTQRILLDGAPVVADVVFERTDDQAKAGGGSGAAEWRTVLVAGGGSAGGFYYALDVTEPEEPTFLWQLSTDDAGEPLFGSYSATPAIATIGYLEGTEVKEVAVAMLPGGEGTLSGSGACGRASSGYQHIDANYQPRGQVRCWAAGPSRSLTIVRLSDGRILKTFRGDSLTDGPTSVVASRVKDVNFDSPITGVPVPYPSRPGQVADRVYVGDADGTLWRITLADPNPANWNAHIAFDGYPSSIDGALEGQPVAIPPVVAVDGIGNTIVLFATGDQEDFFTSVTGMKSRLWSIKESAEKVGQVPFKVEANWLLSFPNGKRVTGPIALFDKVAYFSTFTPTSGSDVCVDGFGSIWGVHYTDSEPSAEGPQPLARLAIDPNAVPIEYEREQEQAAGVAVFGVTVTQKPSCYTTTTVSDNYTGAHAQISSSDQPVYQLVYQTGSGGTASEGSKTNTETQVLPELSEMTRIDSWASIIE